MTDELYDLECRCDRLRDELKDANAAISDLEVQLKFWRQAAEHAVKGWNDLEDRVEAAREALAALEGNVDAARELLGGDRPEPELAVPTQTEFPWGAGGLRVVEDEKPIP